MWSFIVQMSQFCQVHAPFAVSLLAHISVPSWPTYHYSKSANSSQISLPGETLLAAPCSKPHRHFEVIIRGGSHRKSLKSFPLALEKLEQNETSCVYIFGSAFSGIQANISVLIAALTRRNLTHSPQNKCLISGLFDGWR